MTTTVHSGSSPLPWLVRRGARACLGALPAALAAGLAVTASAGPLAVATLCAAPGWLRAATALPIALALTGLHGFAAAVERGERPRVRLDPGLALVLAGGAGLAGYLLTAGGPAAPLGAGLAAGLLLVGPLALAYGALRDRYGLSALRGGLILAAYRPLWALTLLGLAVLGGFAVAATAGALILVVPPLLASVGCAVVGALLPPLTGEHSANSCNSHRGVGSSRA